MVTGAGAITVRVGGEDDEIPAEVVGVSECNDLAVLQLDDPGPYPYFEWSDEAPEPPLDVYALGFPLGDPEYTVTKGVVSKAEADGESSWASVRNVIEQPQHPARQLRRAARRRGRGGGRHQLRREPRRG